MRKNTRDKVLYWAKFAAAMYGAMIPLMLALNFWADAKIDKAELRLRAMLAARGEVKDLKAELAALRLQLDTLAFRTMPQVYRTK